MAGGMMKTIMEAQKTMSKIQKEVESATFDGTVSGDLAVVTINGKGDLLNLKLSSDLKTEDLEMIEDVIKAAYSQALTKKEEFAKQKLKSIGGGLMNMGLKLPGL